MTTSRQDKAETDRLARRIESMHAEREIGANKTEVNMLRLLDMIDGLLVVAEALGGPRNRIQAARDALAGKRSATAAEEP